jgi:hypothetical protein
MVKFTYLPDDRVGQVTDVFSSFNQPENPIPSEISDLTGITDEMVLGHQIDPEAVASFVADAGIVIAHNANFDRKFAERYWPLFEQKRSSPSRSRTNRTIGGRFSRSSAVDTIDGTKRGGIGYGGYYGYGYPFAYGGYYDDDERWLLLGSPAGEDAPRVSHSPCGGLQLVFADDPPGLEQRGRLP